MSQLQVTGEAKIRDIQGPVVANDGVVTALDGAASQYVRGDGTLADFPTSSGGGSSVSYYLNSSVSQGTIGGVAYRELSKDPIIGGGTDIAISSNGYVANYITDVNDPDVTIVPGGNFNCEFYFSVSNDTGNPFTYAELYKYDGTTFTLLGTSVGVPEYINQGTIIAPYYFAIPVPTSALALTDRLAIRIYVNVDGRTVTLHTENSHLCQVVTTLSKGMVSLNNLTDQSQFLTVGTSGTNFAIASTGDTHTFNLPVASATNTGKLSSTDWTTFNNKQNTITDPITGTGASTQIAYFNSGTSITSEAAFNYDASTNRLGVNTSVPNATIGANAGIDSGYSLLLKNDNANYNGIGFGIDSTYGNLISTEKQGTALTRNLTLLNQSGFISLTEAGNLGVGLLTPNTGLDIYNGTSAYLWLHTATSGTSGTDGVRLALFNTNGANLRNFEGSFSITAEGDFSVITLGTENFKINSSDGSIYQSKVANAMLKSVSGVITAAVANTDYQSPISLTTSGSSGAATFSSNVLNVPNYTLAGLNGVPTSRTLTINGTTYDLSADRTWTITSDITGSGADGRVAYWNGTNSITSEAGFIYDASTNRLGVNTTVPNATIGADSALDSGYGLLIKTGASNYNGIGIAIDSTYGNLISTEKLGTATERNLTLLNQSGFVSLKENGSFGVNTLNPAVSGVGIDIYSSTSTGIRFHTATSGTTVSDGAGINFSAGNNLGITNYEAGTIDIVTNGNSGVFIDSSGNVGIKGATPTTALTVNGGAAISALTTGQIVFPTSGGTLAGSSNLFWDNTNGKLGVGTSTLSGARVTISSSTEANHLQLVSNAPAMTFINAISYSYYATVGMATSNNNFITGSVGGDLVLGAYNTNNIWFYNANTNTVRMRIDSDGGGTFSGFVSASGPKSQIRVNGNSVGCGISLSNTIVGANRRNWGIFTEQDVEGDFVIKRSNASGGSAESGTSILSLSRDGAATFSSSVGMGSAPMSSARLTITDGTSIAAYWKATNTNVATRDWTIITNNQNFGDFAIRQGNSQGADATVGTDRLLFSSTGAATFSSTNLTLQSPSFSEVRSLSTTTGDYANFIVDTNNNTDYRLQVVGFGSTASGTLAGINRAGNGFLVKSGGLLAVGTRDSNALVLSTNDTERMRITSGGNVLIGTTTDNGSKFQVNGSVTASSYGGAANIGVRGAGANGISDGPFYQLINTTNSYQILSQINANTDYDLWAFRGSWTKIGTTSATTGVYTPLSDINKKKDFEDSTIGLNAIMGLKPTLFRMKEEDDSVNKTLGFIAQQVKEFIPQAYVEGRDFIGLSDRPIIAALVKAIQEQQAQIEELKALINK